MATTPSDKTEGQAGHLADHALINDAIDEYNAHAIHTLPYLLVASSTAPAAVKAMADYVCTGTNDQAEINAALAAAASDAIDANYPGWRYGHVMLTSGRFNISSAILMNTGNWLSGQGVMTELRAVTNTATGTGSGTYAAVIKAGSTTAHMFQVSDLWIYGNYASGGGCHAIGVTSTSGATRTTYPDFSPDPNIHIHDLFISGFKGVAGRSGIYVDTDWRGTIIDRLQMRHFTNHGIHFNGSPDSHISNVHIGTVDGNGFYIDGGNVKVVSCKAYYCDTRGFYITRGRGSVVACESQDNNIGFEFTAEPAIASALVADTCQTDGIIVATDGLQLNGFQIFNRQSRYLNTLRGLTISGTRSDCTITGAITAANITTKISGSLATNNRNFMRVTDDSTVTTVDVSSIVTRPQRATIYQDGGNTKVVNGAGTILYDAATTAANNVLAFNAANNAVKATIGATAGLTAHAGGGSIQFSDQNYDVASTLDVGVGVSLYGWGSMDRRGLDATTQYNSTSAPDAGHLYYGTTITPTGAWTANVDIDPATVATGGVGPTINYKPVILFGRLSDSPNRTTNNTLQEITNPHGSRVQGITINGVNLQSQATGVGILFADSQFNTVHACTIGGFKSGTGILIYGTEKPDDGPHANKITHSQLFNNGYGMRAIGTGDTDGILENCRITQSLIKGADVSGGWQVMGNHFTTGATTDADHLLVDNAPCVITGNYFDTTGGYAINCTAIMTTINGNYFKGAGSKRGIVRLAANGRSASVVGNTAQLSTDPAQVAFVYVDTTAALDNQSRGVVAMNVIGAHTKTNSGVPGQIMWPVVNNTGEIISTGATGGWISNLETGSDMLVWGNRLVQSNV